MAVNVTAFTSETDQIRLAEAAKKDPGPFISDTEKGLDDREPAKVNANRTISSGTGIDEMEMTRGYAFSQEEGGAVSQTEYIRRKSLHPRPRRGLSAGASGNIDIVLYGKYEDKPPSSVICQSV